MVAEGVEDEGQLAWLLQQGCDYAQGFLFAAPLPAEAMTAYLARQPCRAGRLAPAQEPARRSA